jgi:hypothetical protein
MEMDGDMGKRMKENNKMQMPIFVFMPEFLSFITRPPEDCTP